MDTYVYRTGAGGVGGIVSVKKREGVFAPTGTSELLVASAASVILEPRRILDLGCGSGFIGIALAQQGRCTSPLSASDVSDEAVALARDNARAAGLAYDARVGSLFAPWSGERFDVIVDDVAGISDAIAAVSGWYPPGVRCDAGRDGTKWILDVIAQASGYLVDGGLLIFPVLSLSNEQKILRAAASSFASCEVIGAQTWFLPDSIASHGDLLASLLADGSISCQQKYGAWLWTTRIYRAIRG